LVVHVPQLCCLDRVVGIKGVRDPMVTAVVSTPCYLHFVSYALTLTTFCTISLHRRRLSSCILPRICNSVPQDVGSISCVVGDVGWSIGRSISRSVSCRVSCDAPGFLLASLTLMAKSAKSNRLTLAKPRSTWVITSKTSPTNPIELLNQVSTPLWSTLGQSTVKPHRNPNVSERPPELLPCSPNFT
jgi:hypothetical protein